jgi:hypothetical protein
MKYFFPGSQRAFSIQFDSQKYVNLRPCKWFSKANNNASLDRYSLVKITTLVIKWERRRTTCCRWISSSSFEWWENERERVRAKKKIHEWTGFGSLCPARAFCSLFTPNRSRSLSNSHDVTVLIFEIRSWERIYFTCGWKFTSVISRCLRLTVGKLFRLHPKKSVNSELSEQTWENNLFVSRTSLEFIKNKYT